MLLDIDQLRTFIAIAETGSFTRAADEVYKTQSAVSMQMKRLEERLGTAMFVRDGRQNRLTGDGIRLLEYARKMLELNDEAVTALAEPGLTASVDIGLPDDYADRLLPRVLAAFARSNPNVEITVTCHSSAELTQQIRDGKLDLAIVTHGDCGGMGKLVRCEPLYWVTSEQHATHNMDPLPLAIGPLTCQWRHDAISTLKQMGRDYRIAYVSASAAAISGAVNAGLAVSVLPESTVRSDMRVLRPADGFPALPPCEIGYLRAAHATLPVHDVLVEHIVSRLGNLPIPQIAAE